MLGVPLSRNEEKVGPAQRGQPKLPRAVIASVGVDDAFLAHIGDAVAGRMDALEPFGLGVGDARLDIEAGRMLKHEFARVGVSPHDHDPATLHGLSREKGLAEQLARFRLDREIEQPAFDHEDGLALKMTRSMSPIRSPMAEGRSVVA